MTTSPSRKLFAHGGVYGASRLVNRSIEFFLIPLYAHLIGADGYAVIQILGVVAAVLAPLVLQGLAGAWFRLRFDHEDPEELRKFEASIIWYVLLSGVIFVGVLSVIGPSLARRIIPGIPFYPLGMLTVLTATALAFVTLYERKLQAMQRPVAFAVFGAVRTILTLGTILWLVAGLRHGAAGRIEAGMISMAVLAVIAMVALRPASPRSVSTQSLRKSLAYGLPLVPHSLAGLTNSLIDRLLLNGILGRVPTGVYTMGYQIAGIGLVIAEALNQAFRPLFISAVKEAEEARKRGDRPSADKTLRDLAQSGLVLVSAVACLMVCLTSVAREVLIVMTTDEFADSWRVIAPVAGGMIAWSCYFVFSQSITYNIKRIRLLPVITIIAAAVNIGVNLTLIPRIGIMGAAWATLTSSTVMAVLAVWFGQASTPLPHRWRRWAMMLVCCMIGLIGLWLLDSSVDGLLPRLALKVVWAAAVVLLAARSADVTVQAIKQLRTRQETPS